MPAGNNRSRYLLTSLAIEDISDISAYTLSNWGEAQRDSYTRELNNAFTNLAETPGLGRAREEIRTGLRSFLTKQHVIFYRIVGDDIQILRVLHKARDAKHLL